MIWKVEFTLSAAKQFEKLDKPVQQRISNFLRTRLVKLEDPRQLGKQLQGALSDFWVYRVGDYRLLAIFEDHRLIIVLNDIAHRRHVYK
jgi:mRNA interferase RelE/StbE